MQKYRKLLPKYLKKVDTFFDSRVSNLMSLKKEGAKVKKTWRTMSAVVSGQAITEPDIESRMVKHQVEQGLSKTSSTKIIFLYFLHY